MRNIIAIADTHFSHTGPQYRKDDYVAAQLAKFRFVLDAARHNDADLVIAGDVFDKRDAPIRLVNSILMVLSEYMDVTVYVVFGNHDSYFHSLEGREKTQLGTLLLSERVVLIDKAIDIGDNTWLYGRSWNEEYPKPIKLGTQILVAHVPVTEKAPPPWMPEAMCAAEMIQKNSGFDYIITGDWHETHTLTEGGATLINCGPLCRMEIGKADFQPSCFLISNAGVERIRIPVESDVFSTDAITGMAQLDNSFLTKFEDSMNFEQGKPTFRGLVEGMLKGEGSEVQNLAKEVLDVIGNN